VKIRPWASCDADFPDDQIEVDDDIVQFGGRNVAEAIAEIVTGLGCRPSEPISAEEQGWELDIKTDDQPLWIRVCDQGDRHFSLLMEDATVLIRLFSRTHPTFVRMLRELHLALAADARFQNIVWWPYKKFEVKGKGAPEPVSK